MQSSDEDLGQEGCYLQGDTVYMPSPAVLTEPAGAQVAQLKIAAQRELDLMQEAPNASSSMSGDVKPMCFMPVTDGPLELNTDYPGLDLEPLRGIPTPEICNAKCKAEELCFAWTWTSRFSVGESPYQCFLKYYLPRTKMRSERARGLVSGMPGTRAMWGELFCFAVMLPDGRELDLVQAQADMNHGIFACDARSVYSSKDVEIADGERTVVVETEFKCGVGGVLYSCLNTRTFIEVWKLILADSRYLRYDWTVKVEPDTVFMVGRLRHFLGTAYLKSVGIAYLNNCDHGLHGAIEVYSRGAVQAFAVLGPVCYSGLHKLDYSQWGESLFMDQCLGKVLQVPRLESYGLLNEDTCGSKDWQDCSDNSVAFHPFKDPDAFRRCVQKAGRLGEDVADSDAAYAGTIQT